MGKKETFSRGGPVDQYRKQIGKHEIKKDKSGKEMKQRSDARKSAMSTQDILLFAGTLLALFFGIYFYFFFSVYLAQDDDPNQRSQQHSEPS